MARSSPHFIKVYFPHLSADHLKIPPAFREYIQHESPGTVSLKGPSGGTWNVEFVKSSKGLLFANGWKEFVVDHSIEVGDFLVFRYDGGLRFSVLVFDATACEKEAAFLARPYGGGHITVVDGIEDAEKEETLGEHDSKALILSPTEIFGVSDERKMWSVGIQDPPSKKYCPSNEVAAISQADLDSWKSRKSKNKTPVYESTTREKALNERKIASSGYTVAANKAKTKLQRGRPAKTSPHSVTSTAKSLSKKIIKVSKVSTSKQSCQVPDCIKLLKCNDVVRRGEVVAKVQRMPSLISQRRPVMKEEVDKALEQAKSFKSKNPFVHVVMRDSYVYVSFFLNIPYPFVREYLPKISRKMTLWDPNGKPWVVNYVSYSSRGGFSAGWGGFSYANNLEKYDVCVFELIKRDHMKVHIFRVVKEIAPLIRNAKCKC